jgi:hypothetical protein
MTTKPATFSTKNQFPWQEKNSTYRRRTCQVRVGKCGPRKYESLEHFNQILYLYNTDVSVEITAVDFDVTDQVQVKS